METTAVSLNILVDKVAVVTLDLPGSKVNVFSGPVMAQLDAIIDQVAAIPDIKGLVIISGKSDNFIAGADINEIRAIQRQAPIKAYEAAQHGKTVFAKLDRLPFPVVAAINGTCLGGGTEMSLACDIRLATTSPKTKIGLPEVTLGFVPGWGACVRLPRVVGLQSALDLILTGKQLDASKAWKIGLVDETVDADGLLHRAVELASGAEPRRCPTSFKRRALRFALERNPLGRKVVSTMALKGVMAQTKGKYPAPVEALKLIMKQLQLPDDKAFDAESRAFAKLAIGDVSRNLVGIFFAQQESKKVPSNVSIPFEINTVGVLGAGVMGSGIAQAAAYAGYKVVLFDINPKALEKGMANIKSLFDGLVEKRKLTREEADAKMAAVSTASSYAPLAGCQFVIEAILEDMKIKQSALADLEKVITPGFVFATNTSSLSVSTMAEHARNPADVVGVHFFNPVHKMPLVEIVSGKQTSAETVAVAKSFAAKLGKTTVTTGDAPGFVVNRILAPYMLGSIVMMDQGVPMKDIEKAATSFGMPMGPLALLDEVGLDIAGHVIRTLNAALGDRMSAPPILSAIQSLKLLGKKGGKGIYLYDKNGKRVFDKKTKSYVFNPDVVAAVTAPVSYKTPGEIQDRLFLSMVNEAILCLQEGVITDPSQLDLAMIMGTGFAPFEGGVLRYADKIGSRALLLRLEYLSRVAGDNYLPCDLLKKVAAEGGTFYHE